MSQYGTDLSKSEVKQRIRECYQKYGKVTTSKLNHQDELIRTSDVYAYWNTMDEARSAAGVDGERSTSKGKKKYTKEEIKKEIRRCYDKHGKFTRKLFRDDDDLPSSTPVKRIFGDFDKARKEADIDGAIDIKEQVAECLEQLDSRREVERKRTSEGMFPDSGFVYTLELTRKEDEKYYYVGAVLTGLNNLLMRMSSHLTHEGHFSAPVEKDGEDYLLSYSDEDRSGVYEVTGIVSVEKVEYPNGNRREYIREKERQRFVEVVMEKNTQNVLGGK